MDVDLVAFVVGCAVGVLLGAGAGVFVVVLGGRRGRRVVPGSDSGCDLR